MMKMFLKILKSRIEVIKLKYRFYKSASTIGKVISCSNPQYIDLKGNVRIKDYTRIDCIDKWRNENCTPKFDIGKGVIINDFFTAFVTTGCKIGDDCIFANRCTIVTENHGMNPESDLPYHAQDLINGPVSIGNNCWIATEVIFLPNSSIGDNCVVAAHSVVNKKFPSNVIIGGAPAKVLKKYNFDTHQWEKVKDDF